MKYTRYLTGFLQDYSLIFALIGLCIVFGVVEEKFFRLPNWSNIIHQVSITGVISLGLMVVVRAGSIDLSVGSVAGCAGAFTSGLIMVIGAGPAILIGMGIALGFGLANAGIVLGLGIPGLVGTMGVMFLARAAHLLYARGYPIYISFEETGFLALARASLGPISYFALIMFGLAGLLGFLMTYTRLGRNLGAIGQNPIAAFFSGIQVNRHLASAFIISAMFSGAGGILLAAYMTGMQPLVAEKYLLECIAAVFIGSAFGKRKVPNIPGTILGVFLLGVISNGFVLMHLPYIYEFLVEGVVLVASVAIVSFARGLQRVRATYM